MDDFQSMNLRMVKFWVSSEVQWISGSPKFQVSGFLNNLLIQMVSGGLIAPWSKYFARTGLWAGSSISGLNRSIQSNFYNID